MTDDELRRDLESLIWGVRESVQAGEDLGIGDDIHLGPDGKVYRYRGNKDGTPNSTSRGYAGRDIREGEIVPFDLKTGRLGENDQFEPFPPKPPRKGS
jgi:hypothetical protein